MENAQNQPAQSGQNVYIQSGPSQSNGLGTASLILGIIALVIVWIPIVGLLAWVCAPLGLIFGLIAVFKPQGKGSAIAGLICSAIAFIISFWWLLSFGAIMAASGSS